MEEVVKIVAEKAGITHAQAAIAVKTVAGILKDRMPESLAGQVDKYLQGTGGSQDIGGMAGKIGGMFGKK